MTNYLEYRLVNGYIHNWLVAGTRALPIDNVKHHTGNEDDRFLQIYQNLPKDQRKQTVDLNVDPLEMVGFEVDGYELTWRYKRCMDDHLVDLSASYPLWTYLSAWAYSILKLTEAQKATLLVTTAGPVDVWLNGAHIHRQDDFNPTGMSSHATEVDLQTGENKILVRFETVGVRECPFILAVQVVGLPNEWTNEKIILVPTQAKYPRRHEIVEEAFETGYLEEVVNHRGAHFNLRWSEEHKVKFKYDYQVQDNDGFSYVEGSGESDKEKPHDVGHTYRIKERPMYVVVRPILLEYFDHNLRYEKKFPIYITDHAYASTPTGTFEQRNREALEDATKHASNLYAEIAKLGLGRWAEFKPDLVLDRVEAINRREAGSHIDLLGLLSIMYRYMDQSKFPEKLKQPLEECVLNFRYWQDEGPAAVRDNDGLLFNGESHSLLFHACETLAGQLFPQHTFGTTGKKGQWQLKKGEKLAMEWLRQRGTQGFQDWDSNDTFEKNILALAMLTSLSEDVTLRELSAVLMDKTFFSMAANSFKGSFGSTHGRTSASMLKSAQLEATSGVSRMMWGTGIYNEHILGTVALATSKYEFPLLIGDVANDVSSKVWSRERSVVDSDRSTEVNKVTYRTPDFMLSSAQDYRAGERGGDEHIWQATMGPDELVFVNHPACISDAPEHKPGFWLGNRSLPRVAQWKDALIAVHHLPENDWMGFTHAYFPTQMFSEYEIRTDPATGAMWAFARKDNGYLVIHASQGFELIRHAPDGFRELRSYGRNNIWLCHMGRSLTDGNFDKFKKRILASKPEYHGLEVRWKTLRGDHLTFGWEGPLLVNAKEQALTGFKHHESPYSTTDFLSTKMDIQSKGTVMRLDFS